MRSTKYSLIHHLKYDYEANGNRWSTCIVKQQIVPYWKSMLSQARKVYEQEEVEY
jgi:hypothetical protein